MDKTFEIISDLKETAMSHKIRNVDVSVGSRENKKGFYDYITMTFVVPKGYRDESSFYGHSEKPSEAPEQTETESVEKNINDAEKVAENGSEALTE